jgi:hypothetical protein
VFLVIGIVYAWLSGAAFVTWCAVKYDLHPKASGPTHWWDSLIVLGTSIFSLLIAMRWRDPLNGAR